MERKVTIHVMPDNVTDHEYELPDAPITVMIGKPGWGWVVFPEEDGKLGKMEGGTAETKEEALHEAEAWAKEWLAS